MLKRIVSLIITLCLLLSMFSTPLITANATIAEDIVSIARSQLGSYKSDINKFTTWYYGKETSAQWCAIFVSWCANQAGVLGEAIPKSARCADMLSWFSKRGEYHSVSSGYTPQKGDIVFFDTDGSGVTHHVEFVSQSGYIQESGKTKVYCIGGNTSNSSFKGSDYVAEKKRNINESSFKIMGYAHPSYKDADTATFDINAYLDGAVVGDLSNYGTFDVWINGSLVADNVNDYCVDWPVGTQYEITDIRATDVHKYLGVGAGSLSGTVGPERTDVYLQFRTLDNIGDSFYARIRSQETGNYVYNQGDNNVTCLPLNDSALEQIWHFQRLEDGTYKIISAWNDRSMDVQGYGTAPGTNLISMPYVGNDAQRWCIFEETAGCKLSAVCTPCVMFAESSTTNVFMASDQNERSAQWFAIEKISTSYSWDVNGLLDGNEAAGTDGYGTFDVWLNGTQVADDVPDYFAGELPIGTTYEIRDIRVKEGRSYNGVHSGSLSGKIGGNHVFTVLNFSTAQPAQVGEPAGEVTANGHKYVYYADKTTWYAAQAFCEAQGGHLVTVTTQEETDLLKSLCGENNIWLGATDVETEGQWRWITGEPFEYANWNSGEPNNAAGNIENSEHYLMTYVIGWNDINGSAEYGFVMEMEPGTLSVNGYLDGQLQDSISEYATVDIYVDGVCVADNVHDYQEELSAGAAYEIRDIRVKEGRAFNGVYSGNLSGKIGGNQTTVLNFSTAQPAQVGEPAGEVIYNGHKYVYYADKTTWYAAQAFCEAQGGHLVTVTTQEENDLLKSLCGENNIWLGGTDVETEGQWKWITGEAFEYANWNSGEPNNAAVNIENSEHYLMTYVIGWNDIHGSAEYGFVMEMEPAILDVSAYLDGQPQECLSGFATVDVYVDGQCVADDVQDYREYLSAGAEYEIRDIRPADGYSYDGLHSGARTGEMSGAGQTVVLKFSRVQYDVLGEPEAELSWNGHRYVYYPVQTTWYTAKALCEKLGGHLVTISSDKEESIVSILASEAAWTGGTDAMNEGVWEWITEEAFDYNNWRASTNEPNNSIVNDEGAENYLVWEPAGWNDNPGHRLAPFICEFDEYSSATAQPTITLKYPTLSFKDEILLNVYFEAENLENVVDMGLITYGSEVDSWNIHNAEKVIPGYRFSEAKGLYMVTTEGIPAKNMVDTLWFAIYAELSDGSYYYTKLVYYSPKMYADSLMGTQGKDLDALLVSMLNYGAAAQTYFDYRTDELINKDLTAQQLASVSAYSSDMVGAAVSVPAAKQGSFASTGGYTERYPSVSFKGAFAINYYCVPEATPVDGITLYYWDEDAYAANAVLTPENASGVLEMSGNAAGRYAGSVKGIPARKVSSVVYVAFRYSDGTTTYNSGILPYSIGEYCGYYAGIQHEFTPMAQATAVYGYYAKQYFG